MRPELHKHHKSLKANVWWVTFHFGSRLWTNLETHFACQKKRRVSSRYTILCEKFSILEKKSDIEQQNGLTTWGKQYHSNLHTSVFFSPLNLSSPISISYCSSIKPTGRKKTYSDENGGNSQQTKLGHIYQSSLPDTTPVHHSYWNHPGGLASRQKCIFQSFSPASLIICFKVVISFPRKYTNKYLILKVCQHYYLTFVNCN